MSSHSTANKVIVVMKGGIGNQLFCYATARRLALINSADLVIDDISGFIVDKHYRRKYYLDSFNTYGRKADSNERLKKPVFLFRNWLRFVNRMKPFYKRNYLEDKELVFDHRLLEFKVNGVLYLDGYWQSENYFKDITHIIKREIVPKFSPDPYTDYISRKMEGCSSIAIHRRWFDPPGSNSKHNLSTDYYLRAIEIIERLIPKGIFFLFSDNPVLASQELSKIKRRLIVVENHNKEDRTCLDLWLMTRCQHFIIANSTFSWWGAWLGEREHSIIITPKVIISGITSWGFEGLIPERWLKI
ncbi:MAG: alpha-1,2-fucosyltransferase [Syntrophales bacterium]|nr:alpha-1,2-fucosyltransferase [Syntrophales bacterium]